MKKALSILLLLLYASTSFGFSVQQFYCCGKLKSVSFTVKQDINEKAGCCENQFNNLKIGETHLLSGQLSSPVKHFTKVFLSTFGHYFPTPAFAIVTRLSIAHPTHAPPLHGDIPIYIFNCTYRI